MVTITLRNGTIQVDGAFSYTRQVGDIGNVSTSNANYTNAFTVKKDKANLRALEGLSLPSIVNTIPYEKTSSILKINGIDVVKDGWLQVVRADKDNIKLGLLDGNMDFWKAIE